MAILVAVISGILSVLFWGWIIKRFVISFLWRHKVLGFIVVCVLVYYALVLILGLMARWSF